MMRTIAVRSSRGPAGQYLQQPVGSVPERVMSYNSVVVVSTRVQLCNSLGNQACTSAELHDRL